MELQKKIWILNYGMEKDILTIPVDFIHNEKIDKFYKLTSLFKKIYNSRIDLTNRILHPNLLNYLLQNRIFTMIFDNGYYLYNNTDVFGNLNFKIKISDENAYIYFLVLALKFKDNDNLLKSNKVFNKFFDIEGYFFHLEFMNLKMGFKDNIYNFSVDLGGYKTPANKFLSFKFVEDIDNFNKVKKQKLDNFNELVIQKDRLFGIHLSVDNRSSTFTYLNFIIKEFSYLVTYTVKNFIYKSISKSFESNLVLLMKSEQCLDCDIGLTKKLIKSYLELSSFLISVDEVNKDFGIRNSNSFKKLFTCEFELDKEYKVISKCIYLNFNGFEKYCNWVSQEFFNEKNKYQKFVHIIDRFESNILKSK